MRLKRSVKRKVRDIDAATEAVAGELIWLSERYPHAVDELCDMIESSPYPFKDVPGRWGQHGRLRGHRDRVGTGQAWMWLMPEAWMVVYKKTAKGPLVVWVKFF
jgi:hypothetical protein